MSFHRLIPAGSHGLQLSILAWLVSASASFQLPAPLSPSLRSSSPRSSQHFFMSSSGRPPIPKTEAPVDNVFKKIIRTKGAKIVYEDDEIMAFWDRSPAAPLHLQIIPKLDPVPRDVFSLTAAHIPLVLRMREVAEKTLRSEGYAPEQALLGFHVPPWISVPHLHMHVIAPKNRIFTMRRLKYDAGLGWFMSADDAIKHLEGRGAVKEWTWWCPFKL